MKHWAVLDYTHELRDGRERERSLDAIQKIMIHRVGVDRKYKRVLGKTGPEIAKKFVKDPEIAKYTGGENPYTFYVGGKTIWQALPLTEVGAHARRFNVSAIGIATIGDWRYDTPDDDTFRTTVDLTEFLIRALGLDPWDVSGHTEAGAGATNTPGKDCPGEKWDMDFFRLETAAEWTMCPTPEERERMRASARRERHAIVFGDE